MALFHTHMGQSLMCIYPIPVWDCQYTYIGQPLWCMYTYSTTDAMQYWTVPYAYGKIPCISIQLLIYMHASLVHTFHLLTQLSIYSYGTPIRIQDIPYAYRISHTHMGRSIRVWADIRTHMGQNSHISWKIILGIISNLEIILSTVNKKKERKKDRNNHKNLEHK